MTVIQKNWNIQKCLMQKSSLYVATSVSNNSGIKLQSIRDGEILDFCCIVGGNFCSIVSPLFCIS